MKNKPIPQILNKIIRTKQQENKQLLTKSSQAELEKQAINFSIDNPPRNLMQAVGNKKNSRVKLIAEVKKASPSKGIIRKDFDPPVLALAYQHGGAAAISCLTDHTYFQGSLNYLKAIKQSVTLPVLCKDFIIHPVQIYQARIMGADAILLITRILEEPLLQELLEISKQLSMTALCEIHEQQELNKLLKCKPELIGINNRNLNDFTVDLQNCLLLRKHIPENIPVVAESGIFTHKDMQKLSQAGISAALVGESLIRQPNVTKAVKILLGR